MWLAMLVSTLGYAQSPLSFGPQGEARWVTEDVVADRFLAYNDEAKGPSLTKGDEVELMVTDGDRVRIKFDDRYGWVSASVLTTEAPEPVPEPVDASNLINDKLLAPTSP